MPTTARVLSPHQASWKPGIGDDLSRSLRGKTNTYSDTSYAMTTYIFPLFRALYLLPATCFSQSALVMGLPLVFTV
jgi:hypothetical protein